MDAYAGYFVSSRRAGVTVNVSRAGSRRAVTALRVRHRLVPIAVATIALFPLVSSAQPATPLEAETAVTAACPQRWEAPLSEIVAVPPEGDPWQGDGADRAAFESHLAGVVEGDVAALSGDWLTVISECAQARLAYLEAVAARLPDYIVPALSGLGVIGGGESPPQADGSSAGQGALSCAAIRIALAEAPSGEYWLDVDGAGGVDAFPVWCDMVADGGGWTLVAAQFEQDPVEWNEGLEADYDPSLSSGRGFALDFARLPAHAETAFGRDLDPLFVDYLDFVYTSGDIAVTRLAGKRSDRNTVYDLHRDGQGHVEKCDPEKSLKTDKPARFDQLTLDRIDGEGRDWCFEPNESEPKNRGSTMDGGDVRGSEQAYAWTIWVR